MSNTEIIAWLKTVINSIAVDGLTAPYVILEPNEYVSASVYDSNLFFEVGVGGQVFEPETENSCVSSCVCSIVLNGALNVGSSFLTSVSDALANRFKQSNTQRIKAFETTDGAQQAYVRSVEQTENGVFDMRFKQTIFVNLDIFEG